jgi:hypothetical protein
MAIDRELWERGHHAMLPSRSNAGWVGVLDDPQAPLKELLFIDDVWYLAPAASDHDIDGNRIDREAIPDDLVPHYFSVADITGKPRPKSFKTIRLVKIDKGRRADMALKKMEMKREDSAVHTSEGSEAFTPQKVSTPGAPTGRSPLHSRLAEGGTFEESAWQSPDGPSHTASPSYPSQKSNTGEVFSGPAFARALKKEIISTKATSERIIEHKIDLDQMATDFTIEQIAELLAEYREVGYEILAEDVMAIEAFVETMQQKAPATKSNIDSIAGTDESTFSASIARGEALAKASMETEEGRQLLENDEGMVDEAVGDTEEDNTLTRQCDGIGNRRS